MKKQFQQNVHMKRKICLCSWCDKKMSHFNKIYNLMGIHKRAKQPQTQSNRIILHITFCLLYFISLSLSPPQYYNIIYFVTIRLSTNGTDNWTITNNHEVQSRTKKKFNFLKNSESKAKKKQLCIKFKCILMCVDPLLNV